MLKAHIIITKNIWVLVNSIIKCYLKTRLHQNPLSWHHKVTITKTMLFAHRFIKTKKPTKRTNERTHLGWTKIKIPKEVTQLSKLLMTILSSSIKNIFKTNQHFTDQPFNKRSKWVIPHLFVLTPISSNWNGEKIHYPFYFARNSLHMAMND